MYPCSSTTYSYYACDDHDRTKSNRNAVTWNVVTVVMWSCFVYNKENSFLIGEAVQVSIFASISISNTKIIIMFVYDMVIIMELSKNLIVKCKAYGLSF